MNTKFSQLVKLNKQKMDKVEQSLRKNAQEIFFKHEEVAALIKELSSLQEPKEGVYQNFLNFAHQKEDYRRMIDEKTTEIARLKKERQQLQELFKIRNIEYEKAKYLNNLELKKMLEDAKRKENKNMDEISVMLYANAKEKK
ncbi:MAG: flagellar FliJ family protein [Helicobacter sp.]|nr:flagellar FliJ family protein [Helicobacter sp.]